MFSIAIGILFIMQTPYPWIGVLFILQAVVKFMALLVKEKDHLRESISASKFIHKEASTEVHERGDRI